LAGLRAVDCSKRILLGLLLCAHRFACRLGNQKSGQFLVNYLAWQFRLTSI
jgi:hypothetical protein